MTDKEETTIPHTESLPPTRPKTKEEKVVGYLMAAVHALETADRLSGFRNPHIGETTSAVLALIREEFGG